MTIYRFGSDSVIDEVAVNHTGGSGVRAYIHAREGTDPQTLEQIKNMLTQHGMKWIPMLHEGNAVIEVRSIGRNGKKLLGLLSDQKITTGAPAKEVNPENKVSLTDKIKKNTLSLSGLFYEAGDLAFVAYGWKDSFVGRKLADPQNLLAGIFYALGSPVVFFFGRGDKSDMQLRHKSYDTLKSLEQSGVTIPQDSALLSVTHNHNVGLFRKAKTKMERYPAELTNSLYGLAGSMILWAGIRDYKRIKASKNSGGYSKNNTSAFMNIGIGILDILSALVSLVPEKPRKEGEPKATGFGAIGQFIQEKPLRIAGGLLGITTIGHGVGSFADHKKAKQTLKDPSASPAEKETAGKLVQGAWSRGVFVGTNLTAEALMASSSKGHGEGVESDPSLNPSIYAVMADLVARSKPQDQERVLNLIADNLSKKQQLDLPVAEIKDGIVQQLQNMGHNPWLGGPTPALAPKTELLPAEEQSKQWQTLVTQPASPELSGAVTR